MASDSLVTQFEQQLQGILNALPVAPHKFLIAFSGGRDSTALLHLAAQLLPKSQLLAVHINHQLSENASQWQQHCQHQAEQLSIEFKSVSVQLNPQPRQSLEELARDARYQVFSQLMQPDDALLVGHHLQDQSETLLLRLFRGAGVKGLSAMADWRMFASGYLLRPLLHLPRQQLTEWLKLQSIEWIEDESNAENLFRRNLIRNQFLPQIRQQWQGIDRVLSATARRMQQANRLLDQLADQDLAQVLLPGNRLDLKPLQQLDDDRLINLLRYWLSQAGQRSLPEIRLQEFVRQLKSANSTASPRQDLTDGSFMACYGQMLWLVEGRLIEQLQQQAQNSFWNPQQQPILTTESFELSAQGNELPNVELRLVFGVTGLKLQCSTSGRFESVGRLMNQAGIPLWYRDYWPLIVDDQGLVAIAGIKMATRTDNVNYKILCDFSALPTGIN
ncbi:tRNA lysidine(34) synthetase TilS [Pelagibaculum spongiae]|uniref:tRNA(Ile)-lysidine synthase n=1 Tax=Pelagibaculum spongiae TaxID=2080658 RepID=A0A2V1GXJ0_9GAMM|nr:tRNA lysidine(34) synthetase TilS [Pelagibaculum spongiae]PVZ64897.1 tRNA lysidine(34) synthetase TilS [Pelagibaculum spongiae]